MDQREEILKRHQLTEPMAIALLYIGAHEQSYRNGNVTPVQGAWSHIHGVALTKRGLATRGVCAMGRGGTWRYGYKLTDSGQKVRAALINTKGTE